jgi:hypothetical protein
MGLRSLRAEQVPGAAERVDLYWPQRLIEVSEIQRTPMPQYSPHFFEEGEFPILRQRMQGKRADHFIE